jgi:hypothetical protein
VRSSDVARLFEVPGPFLSIYLATDGDVDNAAQRVAVRWKTLRTELLEAGTPVEMLLAVDPLIEGSHAAGATLAVIAAADGVVYAGGMPQGGRRRAQLDRPGARGGREAGRRHR